MSFIPIPNNSRRTSTTMIPPRVPTHITTRRTSTPVTPIRTPPKVPPPRPKPTISAPASSGANARRASALPTPSPSPPNSAANSPGLQSNRARGGVVRSATIAPSLGARSVRVTGDAKKSGGRACSTNPRPKTPIPTLPTPKPNDGSKKLTSTIRSIFTPKARTPSSIPSPSPASRSRSVSTRLHTPTSVKTKASDRLPKLETKSGVSQPHPQPPPQPQPLHQDLSVSTKDQDPQSQLSALTSKQSLLSIAQTKVARLEENASLRDIVLGLTSMGSSAAFENFENQKADSDDEDSMIGETLKDKDLMLDRQALQISQLTKTNKEHEGTIHTLLTNHEQELERREVASKRQYRALEKEFKGYKKSSLERVRRLEEEKEKAVEKKEEEVRTEMGEETKRILVSKDVEHSKIVAGYELQLKEEREERKREQQLSQRLEIEIRHLEGELHRSRSEEKVEREDREESLKEQLEETLEEMEEMREEKEKMREENKFMKVMLKECCDTLEEREMEVEEFELQLVESQEARAELEYVNVKQANKVKRLKSSIAILEDRELIANQTSIKLAFAAHSITQELSSTIDRHTDQIMWFVDIIGTLGEDKEILDAEVKVLREEKGNLEWELSDLAKMVALKYGLGDYFKQGEEEGEEEEEEEDGNREKEGEGKEGEKSMSLDDAVEEAEMRFDEERIAELAAGVFVSRKKPVLEEDV